MRMPAEALFNGICASPFAASSLNTYWNTVCAHALLLVGFGICHLAALSDAVGAGEATTHCSYFIGLYYCIQCPAPHNDRLSILNEIV